VRILEGYVWLCTKRPDRVEAAAQTFADVLEEVKARSFLLLSVLSSQCTCTVTDSVSLELLSAAVHTADCCQTGSTIPLSTMPVLQVLLLVYSECN
jgi:hypothetical protein